MATAHQWHSGSRAVTARWPVPVDLLPDEILSSWLVRASLAQGCDCLTLAGQIWPNKRVLTADLDRTLPDSIYLRKWAGIAPNAFQSATLYRIAEQILDAHPPRKAVWPYI